MRLISASLMVARCCALRSGSSCFCERLGLTQRAVQSGKRVRCSAPRLAAVFGTEGFLEVDLRLFLASEHARHSGLQLLWHLLLDAPSAGAIFDQGGIACIKSYQQLLPVKGRQAIDLRDVIEFSGVPRALALPREARRDSEFNTLRNCLGEKRLIVFQGVSE